ncbi:MAG: hypothetical protein II058_02640 [Rhodocyclaceae bacterium]|nr:hypothetical protein [Rhodocyclaceae bacterium]
MPPDVKRMMNPKPIQQAKSADLRGTWPALLRAAQRARLLAAQTGTAVVVERDGVLHHIYPNLPPAQQTPEAAQIATAPQPEDAPPVS